MFLQKWDVLVKEGALRKYRYLRIYLILSQPGRATQRLMTAS